MNYADRNFCANRRHLRLRVLGENKSLFFGRVALEILSIFQKLIIKRDQGIEGSSVSHPLKRSRKPPNCGPTSQV